jgi:hypothetical protein
VHQLIKNNTIDGISGDDSSMPVIKNNWICGNGQFISHCGIFLDSDSLSIVVRNNTIVNNAGYGIWMDSYAYITNCIVWGNGYSSLRYGDNNVTYSCIQGGYDGEGNISDDPCFVDAGANNYHLSPNSPCIDAGDPSFVPDPNETDIDGEPRILDGNADGNDIVDMGADEFYWSPADFDRNEIVNFIDYAILASAWLTNAPNISLDNDNDVDMNDLARFCDDWLWQSAWSQSNPLMMMGAGYGQGAGFTEVLSTATLTQQPQIELQSEPELQVQSAPEPPQPEPQLQPQVEQLEEVHHSEEETREMIEFLQEQLSNEQFKEKIIKEEGEQAWQELVEILEDWLEELKAQL